jgi:hypothetical protein
MTISRLIGYDEPPAKMRKPKSTSVASQSGLKSEASKPESDSLSSPSPSTSSTASTSAPASRKKGRRGARGGGGKRDKELAEAAPEGRKKGGLAREALKRAATKK